MVENGNRAEENHVSSTSASLFILVMSEVLTPRLAAALCLASLSSVAATHILDPDLVWHS